MELALNDLQGLMCYKTKLNQIILIRLLPGIIPTLNNQRVNRVKYDVNVRI